MTIQIPATNYKL